MLRYSVLALLVVIGVCLGAVIPQPTLSLSLQPPIEQPKPTPVSTRQQRSPQFGYGGYGGYPYGNYYGGDYPRYDDYGVYGSGLGFDVYLG